MRMRRVLSWILCLCMVFILLPGRASALDSGPTIPALGIGSTEILPGEFYVLDEDTGKPMTAGADSSNYNVFYDPSAQTLTLRNAGLKSAVYVPGGTIVKLIGENLSGTEENAVSCGIQVMDSQNGSSLTVEGPGSISMYTFNEGIVNTQADGDIIISGGADISIANTQSTAVYSQYGGVTISGAKVTVTSDDSVTSGSSGIGGGKDLVIDGDAWVKVNRAVSFTGKITIAGGSDSNTYVDVDNSGGIAINGGEGIEVTEGAVVEATGTTGLNSFGGSVEIAGNVTATATKEGSEAVSVGQGSGSTGSMYVSGALNASGYVGMGVNGSGDIVIDGGSVKINSELIGIYPNGGGNVEIKNGAEVIAEGPGKSGHLFCKRKNKNQ